MRSIEKYMWRDKGLEKLMKPSLNARVGGRWGAIDGSGQDSVVMEIRLWEMKLELVDDGE